MVPVTLSLTNFLSYGEPERVLDFSLFHVACISGRNGQGKSALLDAITWALWGEARKSSGGHKPDDELLRIGSTRMEVAFVFDIEAERYRVTRTYQRSASGKSSKATLELQVLGAEGELSLTESSMRQTQERLIGVIGLEYSTFINASFLLQGRSDEFTKKKPADRKSILTRILGLDRYSVLQNRAKLRVKRLRDEMTRCEALIEQFTVSEEEVGQWKSELKTLNQEYDATNTLLTEVKEQLDTLSDAIGKQELLAASIIEDRQFIERMTTQIVQADQQIEQLLERIKKAGLLSSQKTEIEERHNSYLELLGVRNEMDASQEAFRIASNELQQAESQLASFETSRRQSIEKLDQEIAFCQKWLKESADELNEKDSVFKQLAAARHASQKWAELRLLLEEAGPVRQQLAEIEKGIASEKSKLETELAQFRKKVTEATGHKAALKKIEQQFENLQKEQIRIEELEQNRARLKEEGVQTAEVKNSLEDQSGLLAEAIDKVLNKKRQVENTTEGSCPTCGQTLTPTHKVEVLQDINEELAGLEKRLQRMSSEQQELEKTLHNLRNAYKEADKQLHEAVNPTGELGKLSQKREHLLMLTAEADALAPRIAEIEKAINEGIYAADLRQVKENLERKMREIDQVEQEARRFEVLASEIPLLEKQWEKIESIEEKKLTYLDKKEGAEKERLEHMEALEGGERIVAYRSIVRKKKEALEAIAFDSEAYTGIKKQIEGLQEVPEQMQALRTAETNLVHWRQQVEEQEKRKEEMVTEKSRLVKKNEDEERQTEGLETLREQFSLLKKKEAEAIENLQTLTASQTRLTTFLEQAHANQEKKKRTQEDLVHIRQERKLFFHLVDAFGKNGIPSLIIEQTLPEIEDKANVLLHRLTEGRMRVRLETLRDKKSGGTQETLEIVIIDDQGVPRAYETYSGGEAFRVNFALRIALSQILAERSGVRIRTLCIDEGFGTQDEEGVQNMIEAIQTIQQDFDKILVITHLDILKEAFPVRIEVRKDPAEGSLFEVLAG